MAARTTRITGEAMQLSSSLGRDFCLCREDNFPGRQFSLGNVHKCNANMLKFYKMSATMDSFPDDRSLRTVRSQDHAPSTNCYANRDGLFWFLSWVLELG